MSGQLLCPELCPGLAKNVLCLKKSCAQEGKDGFVKNTVLRAPKRLRPLVYILIHQVSVM